LDLHAVLTRFLGTLTPAEQATLAKLLNRQNNVGGAG
jgi:hypothetical protein